MARDFFAQFICHVLLSEMTSLRTPISFSIMKLFSSAIKKE